MGAGRKTEAFKLKEKCQPQWTVNCSTRARNLRKSDLGGVIFGCKHNTIEECYAKQLFGLPATHFSYVRNIDPGLPLFLFNHSDRKLHGIFEAASHGKLNINPYGWTEDGSDYTQYPAQDESKTEIQRLKEWCKTFGTVSLTAIRHVDEEGSEAEEFKSINETPDLDESIIVVGGFDGSSWSSSLDLYSPSKDLMRSLSSMSVVRSYASAAKSNGEIYVFGGVNDNLWYDTVESYNPQSNQWVSCPSLNRRKGGLAGFSLNDKIFAIGGGNGVECFSEVEMFDLDVGRWIPNRSMLQMRFAPAAAEINGMLYVVGGYDGKDYLKSIERFDCGEHSWTRLESMTSKRGCISLAVLNEKLYAIGGFNGARMVPKVEVFDPLVGSWMTGESLNDSRGYSGAVVIEDTIYVIGGLKDNGEISDTVEC